MLDMVDTVTMSKPVSKISEVQQGRKFLYLGLFFVLALAYLQADISSPTTPIPSSEISAIGGTAIQSKRDEIMFIPEVLSTPTLSSNLGVIPYFKGEVDVGRTKAQVHTTLQTYFHTEGGSSVSPHLRAFEQTSLTGDWLFISSNVFIYTTAALEASTTSTYSTLKKLTRIVPYLFRDTNRTSAARVASLNLR
jgi:hypothetical protein